MFGLSKLCRHVVSVQFLTKAESIRRATCSGFFIYLYHQMIKNFDEEKTLDF